MIEIVVVALLLQPQNVRVEEVTFAGKEITLVGTLAVPKANEPIPAILLLPGSGPTDRDGNQAPSFMTNILKDLSTTFNEMGYATFRFDKRPVRRYAEQWPKELNEMSSYFSMDNHLYDVESAFNVMKARKEIDSEKLFILGHSEGGMFATALASKLNPKGIILLGAPGRGMDTILDEQLTRNINQLPDGELKDRLLGDTKRAIKEIKQNPIAPTGLHPNLNALFNITTPHLLHQYFNFDPISTAKSYKGYAFVGNGEKDVQISATKDAEPLASAFSNSTLHISPGASHNFKKVDKPTDLGMSGPIVDDLLDSLKAWLRQINP